MSGALITHHQLSTNEEKIAYLDGVLSTLSASFINANDAVISLVDEAKAAIKSLKHVLSQDKMNCVVEMIKKGDIDEAKKEIELKFVDLPVETLEEILKLSYVGKENLKNTIEFVSKAVDKPRLRFVGYKAIYEEMKFRGHTTEIEILLLQKAVEELEIEGTNVAKTCDELRDDSNKIIDKIVLEIENKDPSLSKKINNELGADILNANIPLAIDKFFTGTLEKMLLILQYSRSLPLISHSICLIDATFKKQEKLQNKLDSEQALHLWAHAKYVTSYEHFPRVAQNMKNLCIETCEKLSQNKKAFFKLYQQYIEDTNKDKVKKLHSDNYQIRSILPEFLEFYYSDGNIKKVSNLIKAANAIINYIGKGALLYNLHKEMEKRQQLASFEAFKLFQGLKVSTNYDNYEKLVNEGNIYVNDLVGLKKKVPKCIEHLLWGDTKKCRIINKFFAEPLFSSAGDEKVFTWVPRKWREDQFWNISIDKKTAHATFFPNESETGNTKLEFRAINGVATATIGNSATEGWMIKAIDDEHIKIFNNKGINTARCKILFN